MSSNFQSPKNGSVEAREAEVRLDGVLVKVPEEMRSDSAIRCFLERYAMEQHRFLCALTIVQMPEEKGSGARESTPRVLVNARTLSLEGIPAELMLSAKRQVADAISRLESLVARVLISNADQARELWWETSQHLQAPLLTLSTYSAITGHPDHGGPRNMELRRWQMEQLAEIMKTVDAASLSSDTLQLADVLEAKLLHWFSGLAITVDLLCNALLASRGCAGPA